MISAITIRNNNKKCLNKNNKVKRDLDGGKHLFSLHHSLLPLKYLQPKHFKLRISPKHDNSFFVLPSPHIE